MNKYKFTETKIDNKSTSGSSTKTIEVDEEHWGWGVIYNDGNELHQFGNDGWFHQFKEIDWSKVNLFCMYKPEDMTKNFSIVITPGMKVFHFYRNIVMNHGTPEERSARAYVFGYEKGKTKNFNFILPDDRVVQSSVKDVDLTSFNI